MAEWELPCYRRPRQDLCVFMNQVDHSYVQEHGIYMSVLGSLSYEKVVTFQSKFINGLFCSSGETLGFQGHSSIPVHRSSVH